MSSAIIIGAGPAGLALGMLLAEAGLHVTILERDIQEPPDTHEGAWEDWRRSGVAQFRQSHGLLPRGLQILESRFPRVVDHLRRSGAHSYNLTDSPPPSVANWTPEPEDRQFDSLAASRPVYELAFANAAKEMRIDVLRGTKVTGLTTGPTTISNVPHITGIVTDRGKSIRADVVIDAGGRRSPMSAFLEDVGAHRLPEADGDFRFVYYTRYYRRTGRDFPSPYTLSRYLSGSVSIGTFPADNDTWSVTLYGTNADKVLRSARDPGVFERVIRAHPERAHFVDAEPITEVMTMAGVADRERTMHVDGTPTATGWLPIADAWACTNPILGRGITMGLMHTVALAPAITQTLDRPAELADAWETITREQLRPWYVATRDIDRARCKEMEAVRTGEITRHGERMSAQQAAFLAAALTDPDVFRAQMELAAMLTTMDDLTARPEIQDKIAATARNLPDLPGQEIPTRAELEELLDIGDAH